MARSTIRSRDRRPSPAGLLLLALILLGSAPARGGTLDIGVRLTSIYDDNLLEYSSRDLQEFFKRVNPPRFDIETSDDLSFVSRLEATWSGEAAHAPSLQLHASDSRQLRNGIRDHQSYGLRLAKSFASHQSFTLALGYLPRYYLRTLWEDDRPVPYRKLPRYQPAEYRQYSLAAAYGRRVAGLGVRLDWEHRRTDYLDGFPERDSNSDSLDLSISPRGLGRLRFSLRAGFRRVAARGSDGDESATPDDPDISSHTYGAGIAASYSLRRDRPSLRVRQALDYHVRTFGTTDVRDALHFGRQDRAFSGNWGLVLGLGSQFQIRGSYELALQRTGALPDATESGADAGDFTAHRVSLGLGWTFRPGGDGDVEAE